jgi:hypothetical protein
LPGAIVSDPAAMTSNGPPALASASGSFAYVSVPPGEIPEGVSAELNNDRSGDNVTISIVDGGFDPVAILAAAGDTISVDVRVLSSEAIRRFFVVTPVRRAPTVVRTQPIPGKRDVPLASSIVIVFGEPMDTATLQPDAITLFDLFGGRTPVSGSIAFMDSAHLKIGYTPLEPLAPSREYELVVKGRDLDGDSTEEVRVRFTTVQGPPPDALLTGTLAFSVYSISQRAYLIYTMKPDGSELRSFTEGRDPQWSPDGTRIVFWLREQNGVYAVYVMNSDGSGYRRLAPGYDPAWSPDGQTIVFGCGGICVMNADGSGVTALTTHVLNTVPNETCIEDSNPRWSPDGSTIWFLRYGPGWPLYGGPNGVPCVTKSIVDLFPFDFAPGALLIAPDGTGERRVPEGMAGLSYPSWSPDGTRIAGFTITEHSGRILPAVIVSRADGTGTPTIAYVGEEPWVMFGGPAWSPDGSRLVIGNGREIVFPTPTGSDVYTPMKPFQMGVGWSVFWSWSPH